MHQNLFSIGQRTNNRPAMYGEHHFSYLDISACSEAQEIRNFLENAFNHYPYGNNLKKRLQDNNVVNSKSAIFELILHEMLLKMGYQVEIEPKVANKRKPDFFVTTLNGNQFYIEAVLACDYDSKKASLERVKNALIDQLNSEFLETQYVTLWISIIKQPESAFRKKKLYADIRCKLNALQKNNDEYIQWIWKDEKTEWCIELQLWKRSDKSKRFVSTIYPPTMSSVNVPKAVKGAFKKKSTKYGILKHPLILAINVDTMHLDRINEMEALFGQETICFTNILSDLRMVHGMDLRAHRT